MPALSTGSNGKAVGRGRHDHDEMGASRRRAPEAGALAARAPEARALEARAPEARALAARAPGSRALAARGAGRRAGGLGWFSIGLGLAQIVAPRGLARAVGLRDDERTRTTMLAIGLREIMSGVGILTRTQPAGWVWARVAGDLMDLALLGRSTASSDADRRRVAGATAALAGVTLFDAVTAVQLGRGGAEGAGAEAPPGLRVAKAITVGCAPAEAYQFWRDFQNLPRFMTHLESLEMRGARSVWRMRGPAGTRPEWEAEVVDDVPNERLAWRSVEGASVATEGAVSFTRAPGGRGTQVRLELSYAPPGGAAGAAVAKLLGALPAHMLEADLRRFKQLIEVGEIVQSDASIHLGPHPARPAEGDEGARGLDLPARKASVS